LKWQIHKLLKRLHPFITTEEYSMPSIAVIGASADRNKFGNICVRAYVESGYDVYPINPVADEIEGLTAYRSVLDIPDRLDRVSIYLPPEKAFELLEQLNDIDVGEIWINPGVESEEIIDKLEMFGLNYHTGCSIMDIGINPGDFAQS
jgi:uncharacterized protein